MQRSSDFGHMTYKDILQHLALEKLKDYDPDTYEKLINSFWVEYGDPHIELFGWNDTVGSLKILHSELRAELYSLIPSDYPLIQFEAHFRNNGIKPDSRIPWLGNLNVLVFLFFRLRKDSFIFKAGSLDTKIHNHFLDKDGVVPSTGSIGEMRRRGIKKDDEIEMINRILNATRSNRKRN